MTKVGVLKEIKNHEYRVGLTPSSVRELVSAGHSVYVEHDTGKGIGFLDEHYVEAGATIVPTAKDIFDVAELIVKVKEPQLPECEMLKPHHTLFAYLHLAPDPKQAQALLKSGAMAIAYDTVTDIRGGLPLLAPMSEVAGRMSIQVGAHFLEKEAGGQGMLLSGVAGVAPGNVVVIGGGAAGASAARIASGMGANVVILDNNARRLAELDWLFQGRVRVVHSNRENIEKYVVDADLVVGAVLVVGASAPKLVTRDMVKKMRQGSVLVDIAIDQGGCFETSRPTTHDNPTYVDEGVVHYCVTNMPGAVARTSAVALNNATLPFVLQLANKGTRQALIENLHLRDGLNVCSGKITHPVVARDLGVEYITSEQAIAA